MRPQLFLLHFAGGNGYSFQFLLPEINTFFETHVLELPGRGRRIEEPLLYSKPDALQDVFRQIKEKRNGSPYLIYGHSMGASLGLLLTSEMEKLQDPPVCFIPTGNAGPGVSRKKDRYKMPQEAFIAELKILGGVPDEVFENKEIFDFFEPVLRADFEIVEKEFEYPKGFTLHTPIIALMGSDEEDSDKIENWKNYTHNRFQSQLLKGDHFFIHRHKQTLASMLKNAYRQYLPVG
ncbi:MAG: alpha/beta fold hydrolase [Bacteroidota bacterium]